MAETQTHEGWMVKIRHRSGKVEVFRGLPKERAEKKVQRARSRGYGAEMKPEPRAGRRSKRERYVNRHPRRCAA